MVILKDQPVYLLAGSEQFLKEENLARIKSTFLDKESEDFNFNIFYASLAQTKEILECVRTLPFLGRKRVVLVRQVEDFSISDKKLILSYVRNPQKQALLILETSETNLYEDFFAEISKYARLIFCKPLKDKQLFDWIKAQVEAKDKRIEEKAKSVLVDNLGNDLQLLSKALDNLILYIGARRTIEASDVEKMVGPDLTTSAFDLFDAASLGDKEKALGILDSLFKEGINSSQILGALIYQVVSERESLSFRERLKSPQFERILEELQKTDADIKTGRQTQKIALELLLVRLSQLI